MLNDRLSFIIQNINNIMKIKDMPKDGRPRERFLKQGPEALSDAELFAIN